METWCPLLSKVSRFVDLLLFRERASPLAPLDVLVNNARACFISLMALEEWTTTRKIINHKTRQTETRVQRQIVMEDGKVIADSGPQVTTRTKEDNDQEEIESTSKKTNGNRNKAPGHGYIRVPGSTQVVSEKTETRSKTREAKQENLQYHDEGLRELTGFDVHKKALVSPNDLIELRDEIDSGPKGNLTHYSSKTRKTCDKEEIKEIGKVHRDGERTTEVTRTMHHEEVDDDELPERDTIGMQLPEAYRETSRNVQYHKNWDDEDEEDAIARTNSKKLAIANVERHHDSMRRYKSAIDSTKETNTTDKWVESHFGSESDFSGSGPSSGSDEVVRKARTKAGGNIINIELESHRVRTPTGSNRGNVEKDTFTSRTFGQNTTSSHVQSSKSTQRAQTRGSSRGSSPSPPRSPKTSRNPQPVHLYTYSPSPRASPLPKTSTPLAFRQHKVVYEGDDEDYSRYNYRVNGSSGRRSKSPSRRSASPGHGLYTQTTTVKETRSGRSTPSKTFCFGDANDTSYHRTVKNERIRDVNHNRRDGVIYHSVRPA